jgi:hypothetical protein
MTICWPAQQGHWLSVKRLRMRCFLFFETRTTNVPGGGGGLRGIGYLAPAHQMGVEESFRHARYGPSGWYFMRDELRSRAESGHASLAR